ncbi:MAG: NlpC/P60 family protein [Pseudomonadota bacterium]
MPNIDDPRLMLPPGADGLRMQVSAAVASLKIEPELDAEQGSQLLHGEEIILHHEQGEFGLVQAVHDRYVGWALMEALSAPVLKATHRVRALRAYVFPDPSIKSSPFFPVSMGAQLHCEAEQVGRFVKCTRSGWMVADQLQPVDQFADDPATIAEKYMHTPYLWGGRESLGIDCSGLIQHAFAATGVRAPRDSDMQAAWLGAPIENWQQPGQLRRNDLVFWKGHVGIMLSDSVLLHGNGHHMAVAAEPLSIAIERIRPQYGEPTLARRVDPSAESATKPAWFLGR